MSSNFGIDSHLVVGLIRKDDIIDSALATKFTGEHLASKEFKQRCFPCVKLYK